MAVITGGNGPDNLPGTAQGDTIRGLLGNDTITGLAGNDTILGGNGTGNAAGVRVLIDANVGTLVDNPLPPPAFGWGYGTARGQLGVAFADRSAPTEATFVQLGSRSVLPVAGVTLDERPDTNAAGTYIFALEGWGPSGEPPPGQPSNLDVPIVVNLAIGSETKQVTLTARPEVQEGDPTLIPDPGFVDDPAIDYSLLFQPRVAVFDDGTAFDVEVLADVPGDDSFQSTLDLARDGDSEGLIVAVRLRQLGPGRTLADDDRIKGNQGDDTLDGESGNDLVDAGKGNDVARGGAGNDTVLGSSGFDRVFGGDGADLVRGGEQRDQITGGPGDDTFSFLERHTGRGAARDVIRDFRDVFGNDDVVDLGAIDANKNAGGNQAFRFGGQDSTPELREVSYFRSGADIIVAFNDGRQVAQIELDGARTAPDAGDFIL